MSTPQRLNCLVRQGRLLLCDGAGFTCCPTYVGSSGHEIKLPAAGLTHETWGHDPKSAPAWLACPTVRYRRSVRRLSRNAQRATHVSVGTALHQHAHVGCPWPFGSGLNFGPLRRESRGPPTVFTPSTTARASVGALPCTLARILRHVSGVVHLCEYRISATFTDSLVHMDRSRSHYLGKSRGWLITPCATKGSVLTRTQQRKYFPVWPLTEPTAVAEDALSLACLFITNMSDGECYRVWFCWTNIGSW